MRWFNFVGMGMLAFGIVLNEWVYMYLWEKFNVAVVIALAMYILVAIGLSVWEGPSRGQN
jgi:hypothetical protein